MEPVSLIVAALVAGSSEAIKDTAAQAVKDAYAGLRRLLKRKSKDEPSVADAVDGTQGDPAGAEEILRRELARVGVADDEEVVRAAQRLLALIDPEGARGGKYNVTISGGKGVVVGDHAHVEMTFGDGD